MGQQDRDERLLVSPIPEFDASAGLGRFRERVGRDRVAPSRGWIDALMARMSLARGAWARPLAAAAAIVLVASLAAVTGLADTVLTVFEPKQVATIQVDPRQLRGVPDPTEYGTLTWIAQPSLRPVADASTATAAAGFEPLVPASLPAGVPSQARFAVMGESKATFQFDEAKARAAAARVNATLPPMPPAIATTTLTMTGGPAIMQQYGSGTGGWTAVASGPLPAAPQLSGTQTGPLVVIVQARAPVVTSNGATVEELRDYLLAQPGIPPALAAQLRAIGDPVRTLLFPLPLEVAEGRTVTVRGTQGVFFADSTGLGSGVVWVKDGFVHAVLSTMTESELLALVNALR